MVWIKHAIRSRGTQNCLWTGRYCCHQQSWWHQVSIDSITAVWRGKESQENICGDEAERGSQRRPFITTPLHSPLHLWQCSHLGNILPHTTPHPLKGEELSVPDSTQISRPSYWPQEEPVQTEGQEALEVHIRGGLAQLQHKEKSKEGCFSDELVVAREGGVLGPSHLVWVFE